MLLILPDCLTLTYNKMETKTVSIRLPMELVDYLSTYNASTNQAIVDIIERVRLMEKYADVDVEKTFNEAEFKCLHDILHDVKVRGDYRYKSTTLIAQIEDACDSDKEYTERWNIDVVALTDKIAQLSSSAIEAIYRKVEK